MPRLTKKFIDGLRPKSHDVFVWDSEILGLGVRLKPSGTKTFFIQYRNKSNRTRRTVICQFGVLTTELAREMAREQLVEVIRGEDPSGERKAARNAYTVKGLCSWHLLEAKSGRLLSRKCSPIKASTSERDRSCIETHIRPLVGHQVLEGITREIAQERPSDFWSNK